MRTVEELRRHADERLLSGNYPAALYAYRTLVQLQPNDLDPRLRIADTLLAMGEVQAAAWCYTKLAQHAAAAGYPLRALIALKVLEALEPQLGELLDGVASLYGKGSLSLGRAVRMSLGDMRYSLPDGFDPNAIPALAELLPSAAQTAADLSRIAAYPQRVPPIPLFSELPKEAFADVLRGLRLARVRPGEEILKQGDAGASFFVLARGMGDGVLERDEGETVLAQLHDGAIFGEMALVSAQPRNATIRAASDADLFEFDRATLEAAASSVDSIARALENFTRERLLHNLVTTSPLFRPLEKDQRWDLVRRFQAHDVTQGTDLIHEGQEGRGLFVLLSGEADVWKRDGDEKVLLATLKPGDVFGEISLLYDEPTTATVTAGTRATVLALPKELFRKLIERVDGIRTYIEELGDQRMLDARLTLDSVGDYDELDEDDLITLI